MQATWRTLFQKKVWDQADLDKAAFLRALKAPAVEQGFCRQAKQGEKKQGHKQLMYSHREGTRWQVLPADFQESSCFCSLAELGFHAFRLLAAAMRRLQKQN